MNFSNPSPVNGDSTHVRIVAALNSRERNLFLEPALKRSELNARITFVAEDELDAENWTRRIENWRPEILITGWSTPPLPEDWLRRPDCPLRYVCHVAGSVRQLVPRFFIERGGVVTNWGDRISGQVAEHGLLLALAALRNQSAWAPFMARPIAERQISELRTRTLFGLRVGLHGFGSIARALLPLLRPFGATVMAYSAGVPEEIFARHGIQSAPSLAALFSGSDVLFECESLTPLTRGTVSAAVLAELPDDAVFINIGRGGLVDDDALVREAKNGRLRLGLDVISDEPVSADSPFLTLPGVVLSPHIGGPTLDRYADCGAHALANVSSMMAGFRPADAISVAMYDRAT
jgi:phosphoglycerate dehydrogenase-like enzyme